MARYEFSIVENVRFASHNHFKTKHQHTFERRYEETDQFEAKGKSPGLVKSSLSSIACFDGGFGLRLAGVTCKSGKALRVPLLRTHLNIFGTPLGFSITFKAQRRSDVSVELRLADDTCIVLRPMGQRKQDRSKKTISAVASKRSGRLFLLPVREILHDEKVSDEKEEENIDADLASVARKLRSGGMSPQEIRTALRVESEKRERKKMEQSVWTTRVYVSSTFIYGRKRMFENI